jgi:hypothetical protein
MTTYNPFGYLSLLLCLLISVPTYGMNERDLERSTIFPQLEQQPQSILQNIQNKVKNKEAFDNIVNFAEDAYKTKPEQLCLDITNTINNKDKQRFMSKENWLSSIDILLNALSRSLLSYEQSDNSKPSQKNILPIKIPLHNQQQSKIQKYVGTIHTITTQLQTAQISNFSNLQEICTYNITLHNEQKAKHSQSKDIAQQQPTVELTLKQLETYAKQLILATIQQKFDNNELIETIKTYAQNAYEKNPEQLCIDIKRVLNEEEFKDNRLPIANLLLDVITQRLGNIDQANHVIPKMIKPELAQQGKLTKQYSNQLNLLCQKYITVVSSGITYSLSRELTQKELIQKIVPYVQRLVNYSYQKTQHNILQFKDEDKQNIIFDINSLWSTIRQINKEDLEYIKQVMKNLQPLQNHPLFEKKLKEDLGHTFKENDEYEKNAFYFAWNNIKILLDIYFLNNITISQILDNREKIIKSINFLANTIDITNKSHIFFIEQLNNPQLFNKQITDNSYNLIVQFLKNDEEAIEEFQQSWNKIKNLIQPQKQPPQEPQQSSQQQNQQQNTQQQSSFQQQQHPQIILEQPISLRPTQQYSQQQQVQQPIQNPQTTPQQQQQQIQQQTQPYQQAVEQPSQQQPASNLFTQLTSTITSGLTNIWNAISSLFTRILSWRPW